MSKLRYGWRLIGLALVLTSYAAVAAPSVVTSIKPVHALVAGVMAGVGMPLLLVDGAASPHDFALRPSQAEALSTADLIVWIGPQLEAFLVRPLATLAPSAQQITVSALEGITLLRLRDSHAGHEGHSATAEPAPAYDMHLWLDPVNAAAMVGAIAARLQQIDAANAQIYAQNAAALAVRLDASRQAIQARLSGTQIPPFVVFHDAYQYFEKRFGLQPAAVVTLDPERPPGAARIRALQKQMRQDKVACVFAEPQFESRLIATLVEGTPVQISVLDPLGAGLPDDGELYFSLLDQLATGLTGCKPLDY